MRTTLVASVLVLSAAGCGPVAATHVNPSLGAMVTRDNVVLVEQTPEGVRYTLETRDGDLIAANLTREELAALDPRAAESLEQGTALDASLDTSVLDSRR